MHRLSHVMASVQVFSFFMGQTCQASAIFSTMKKKVFLLLLVLLSSGSTVGNNEHASGPAISTHQFQLNGCTPQKTAASQVFLDQIGAFPPGIMASCICLPRVSYEECTLQIAQIGFCDVVTCRSYTCHMCKDWPPCSFPFYTFFFGLFLSPRGDDDCKRRHKQAKKSSGNVWTQQQKRENKRAVCAVRQ